jgi:peptidoglycan DL-endopeptidase CwlO
VVPDDRKWITRLLMGLGVVALVGSVLTASPSSAEPEIEDVQARVDRLYHEAEIASERFNEARVRLSRSRSRLATLRADLAHKRGQVEEVRREVVSSVVAQSQGQVFSAATQIALSERPDAFLEQLVVVSQYNDVQTEMRARFTRELRQLEMRREAAERELEEVTRTRQELASQKETIDEKAAEAQDLLERLEAEAAERAAARAAREARAASRALAQSRESLPAPTPSPTPEPAPAPVPAASGRAAAAVEYALAQVGDAYVWGAEGPDAFDCSGLTLMAWRQAGVSLPHSSSMQMSSGTPVSQSQLQPGDLVFYYSPVSHVGIYVGGGKIVHAANPSTGVEIAPVFSMPYSGAVRPG